MEQLLKRKRAEIVDLWEERESNLKKIRAKEAMMEEREKKRRRHADGSSRKDAKDPSGDEEEWLLDEEEDEDVPGFSDIGKGEVDDSEEVDQVKVGLNAPYDYIQPWLTKVVDILYVKNTLSVDAICCRATPTDISAFGAK